MAWQATQVFLGGDGAQVTGVRRATGAPHSLQSKLTLFGAASMMRPVPESRLPKPLAAFHKQLQDTYSHSLGFPGSTDFAYQPVYGFFDYLLNNVGNPFDELYPGINCKQIERDVVNFFADLFRAPVDDRWGYVTSGGSEGNLYALYLARERLPGARLYYSQAAHYSVAKSAHILQLPTSVVGATPQGEMDYDDLATQLAAHPGQPAIVVATIGTTMTEARDNVSTIKAALVHANVPHFIHSDAALAGTYTALLPGGYSFDLADGADSISVSGHKFIGSPFPCGIVVTRRSYSDTIRRSGHYTGSADMTISGSRSGHAPILLWYAIHSYGLDGLRQRAMAGLELAEYALGQLQGIGWKAWRNPDALTVLIAQPSPALIAKWQLASQDGWSHIICMPGVTKKRVDDFVADLAASSR